MIKISVSPEDMMIAKNLRFNHPHPRVQLRMEVLWLKCCGLPHNQICAIAGISSNTLRQYLRLYEDGGIENLKKVNFHHPQSELVGHQNTIESYFREHPVSSIPEAIAIIEERTGLQRKTTQVRKFLKSIGMARRKVGSIPSKADPDEQEKFKKEKLEPCLEEAKSGKRVVFFVDAAHFVLSAYLGFLWCFKRIFVKTPAGRKRFNVLGALNAINHDIIMVTNDLYINAQSVCELLCKIAHQYRNTPITLILDNARYQKCALVTEMAASLNIELLYLPPYSPNLNLIERLWKFVKKKCLYSKYYPDFTMFKQSIFGLLLAANQLHKKELESLLTLRFQTFKRENPFPQSMAA